MSEPAASPVPPNPATRAAWAAPLDRFDRAWTRLDARLCAFVLVVEILTLVFWISMKALSSSGAAGPGLVYRRLLCALFLGLVTHWLTRHKERSEAATTAAVVFGLILGGALGDAGSAYFANLFSWMQNASILVFFGGVSELAKRLTLLLAMLGASVATGQGKHITVDVVLRFLSPRARVPVAVLGWVTAAVVSIFGAWGFFDNVAVAGYHVNPDLPGGAKVERVVADTGRNLSLATAQLRLDVRSLPRVLTGTPYATWLTPADWNAFVRGGALGGFKPEDVKGLELPEDGSVEYRTPAVTAVPGSSEQVRMLLTPLLNLVVAFGLLVIAVRFLLRSILALTGWVDVDPDAAHGDADLEHAHDDTATAAIANPAAAAEAKESAS